MSALGRTFVGPPRTRPSARCTAALSLVFLSLLALAADPCDGQEVTGTLQGSVVSVAGTPEPDVRIVVSGPHLQGTRETITDRRGFFQFLALPPGSYELRANRLGLRPLDVHGVRVELGHTVAVGPLTLEPQPIELEPVVVPAHPLSIDPVHTAAGGTLTARDYAALPVERDYRSLMAVLPHANDSYRGDAINVGGSTGLENVYYIDGVNVTDVRAADRATSLPYEFVRVVDVKTGGYEAQYGRAMGAVVNAVTYSGTNDFDLSAFGYAQPDRLTARSRLAPVMAETEPISYDFGIRVGGPILRDRLWYSAAVNPRVDRVDRRLSSLGYFTDKTTAVRFANKVAWQANAATNLELSVFGDPTVHDEVAPPVSGITTFANPDPQLRRVESGGVTTSLRATVTPSRSLLLQGSSALQRDRYTDRGATSVAQSEPAYYDYFTGMASGGYGYDLRDDRDRTSVTLRGTLTLSQHTLVSGIDYEDTRVKSEFLMRRIERGDSSTYWTSFENYQGTFHDRYPAVYLQDAWRVTDRLTLNAGLRWSGQYLGGASGHTDQRITDEWQPRMGFSWQIGRVGTQRIFGSYGRYYQTLPMNISVLWFVDYTALYTYYSTDPRQPGAIPDTTYDGSTPESMYATQIPGLEAENFDEFTLGYERLLGTQSKLTVRGMRRDLRSSFQWGVDFNRDPIWVFGTPGQGDFSFLPPPKRQYTALEVAAEGTWRKLQYRTSYVLSRSWGNYPGLFNSDFSFSNPGQATTFWMENQAANSTGYLPNDRTHVFKLSAAYVAGFGLSTGGFLSFESGAPVNDFVAGPWGPVTPSFLVQRGTAGRTPALWNLDLRLAYELTRARMPRTRVQLDLLHVGNPRRATQLDELHYASVDETGSPATSNPNYRQPIAYQPPMAARLGIQMSF